MGYIRIGGRRKYVRKLRPRVSQYRAARRRIRIASRVPNAARALAVGGTFARYAAGGLAGAAVAAGGYGIYRRSRAVHRLRVRRRALRNAGRAYNHRKQNKVFAINNDNNGVGYADATLHFQRLIGPLTKQTTSDEINLRDSDSINVAGVKFDWEVANITSTPMYFNWCVVIPKDTAANSITLDTNDFFRAHGTGSATAFDNLISGWDRYTRPINNDVFDIIHRSKFMIGEMAAGGSQRLYKPSLYTIEKWLPINREFTFGSDGTVQGPQPYVCWWLDNENKAAAAAVLNDRARVNRKTLLYFKDSK